MSETETYGSKVSEFANEIERQMEGSLEPKRDVANNVDRLTEWELFHGDTVDVDQVHQNSDAHPNMEIYEGGANCDKHDYEALEMFRIDIKRELGLHKAHPVS